MTSQKRLFAKPRMAAVVLALLTFASGALLRAQTERSLYYWSYPQIEDVRGGLVADSSGNLYGTSVFGGTGNAGTVFELSPPAAPGGAWTESVLYNFPGDNSSGPAGTLVFDSSGNLYGTSGDRRRIWRRSGIPACTASGTGRGVDGKNYCFARPRISLRWISHCREQRTLWRDWIRGRVPSDSGWRFLDVRDDLPLAKQQHGGSQFDPRCERQSVWNLADSWRV